MQRVRYSALPGLMQPFELLAKDDKTGELIPFHPPGVSSFDGTITADIPAARLTVGLYKLNSV
jgi:TAG lipase/steryl ester hydrolase/phospholipase A2/LPA acyltransferase